LVQQPKPFIGNHFSIGKIHYFFFLDSGLLQGVVLPNQMACPVGFRLKVSVIMNGVRLSGMPLYSNRMAKSTPLIEDHPPHNEQWNFFR